MSRRQVLQVFEMYQNARTQFVQTVAEQATRPQNIETLQNAETEASRAALACLLSALTEEE